MDESSNDLSTPAESEGFIGKHMAKLAEKKRKIMVEKLAKDEEEKRLVSGMEDQLIKTMATQISLSK